MKTLNIKLPYKSLVKFKDVDADIRNAVFRDYLEGHRIFTEEGYWTTYQYDSELYQGHMVTYMFKVDDDLHKALKLESIKQGVNMNLYAGQVITHEIEKRG